MLMSNEDYSQAYVTSTQLYNWQLTADELFVQRQKCNKLARRRLFEADGDGDEEPTDSKTSVNCLNAEDELKIVKRYILIMKALFHTFKEPVLPADIFGFAATYFKRFYLNHSVMDFFPREMMLTSLYLACKAADFPLGLQHFISHIPRNRERYGDFIVNSELFLMEALHYDLWIHTPYRPLCGLIVDLVAYRQRQRHRRENLQFSVAPTLSQTVEDRELVTSLKSDGYEIIHTWYQTDICLSVTPSQFACAVLLELGRHQPELGIEVFLRDEVVGCNPLKEPRVDLDDEEDKIHTKTDVVSKDSLVTQFTPQQRWSQLSERLDQIHSIVSDFEFVTQVSQFSGEEALLEKCRNPLYDPLSEEYAAAKERANSLLASLD